MNGGKGNVLLPEHKISSSGLQLLLRFLPYKFPSHPFCVPLKKYSTFAIRSRGIKSAKVVDPYIFLLFFTN